MLAPDGVFSTTVEQKTSIVKFAERFEIARKLK
jgi:hypothetical protein